MRAEHTLKQAQWRYGLTRRITTSLGALAVIAAVLSGCPGEEATIEAEVEEEVSEAPAKPAYVPAALERARSKVGDAESKMEDRAAKAAAIGDE